jgi:DNA-binding NarL/FixJ family response regulator
MEAHRCSKSQELVVISLGRVFMDPGFFATRELHNQALQFKYEEPNMTNVAQIRIMSVEDHPLLREGIAAIIKAQPDMSLVAEAAKGKEAIEKFRLQRPDVALMDLRLPDLNGIESVIAIRSEFPDARIIILTTAAGDVEVNRALKAGARAYLLKSMPPQQMLATIREVHSGKRCVAPEVAAGLAEHFGDESLSDREAQVLRYAADGNRNQDIAEKLFIAVETVKVHMKHILEKLGANDRTQAVAIAVRRGIIQL